MEERSKNVYTIYAELKRQKGVTDYEVAKQTKISTATLTNWKKGRYVPKVDKLQKLADYFGVPVTEFLESEVEE